MKSIFFQSRVVVAVLSLLLVAMVLAGVAAAQTPPTAAPATAAKPAAAPVGARAFDTPQEAADALIKACASFDVPELLAILGPDGKDIVASSNQVDDKKDAQSFATRAAAKNSIEISKSNPHRASLIVGDDAWPLPVPLVKVGGKWYFSAKDGRREILLRRIGANELDAITVCRGYVEAQKDYASESHDGTRVHQYAQKIFSSPGRQDGLYWKNADGSAGGPLGDAIAKALEEGYASGKTGYHGYYFKILKGQGPAAPNGAINYVISDIMIGGFALVAVPAEYRVTGVKTFIVNQDGIVYQKDLGANSLDIAKKMELYNPDKTWQPTDDAWPESSAP